MAEFQQQPQQPMQAYQSPPNMNEKAQSTPQQPAVGQHSHAPAGKWSFGFWDCFQPLDICCWAYWCPCILFGRTHDRNATGEKEPLGVGLMCVAWYGLAMCGCSPCLQCVKRGETRQAHQIQGSTGMDFLSACCCPCCALVQEEKESVVRVTGVNPVTKAVYQPVQPMTA